MARRTTTVVFIVILFLLTACNGSENMFVLTLPPPTPANVGQQTAIAQAAGNATEAAVAAMNAEATNQAVIGQATAEAITATAVSVRATEHVESIVTGTARAIQARETEIYISAMGTRTVMDLNATATMQQVALGGTATEMASLAETKQEMIDQEATRIAMENQITIAKMERTETLLYVSVAIIVMILVGTFTLRYRTASPEVVTSDGQTIILVHTPEGLRPIPQPRLPKRDTVLQLPASITQNGVVDDLGLFADWNKFCAWNEADSIIVGATATGNLSINLSHQAHLLVAGKTGSGKTRRMLWIYAAALLARQAHVIICNEQGADFAPFYGHQNVTIIRGTDLEIPKLTYNVVGAVVLEMNRRSQVLQAHRASTWSRLPEGVDGAGELVVMIDEFLSLAKSRVLERSEQNDMMGMLVDLTSKGRKFGIRMVFAATSPGQRALGNDGMTIRDNCGRICFSVEDPAVSRAVLRNNPEAAGLPPGYVVASVGSGTQKAATFSPTEDQIGRYIQSRPVSRIGLPQLVDSIVTDPAPAQTETGRHIHPRAEDMVRMRNDGSSKRQIEEAIFGYTGGEAFETVTAVLERAAEIGLMSATTTV